MIADLPVEMTMDDVVILASIIEREAKNPDDRHIIAGVLYNRLGNKDPSLRRLQVDATIQYIYLKRTGSYKDRLLYEDYEIEDIYNTYLHEGLPPGPICCPGEASIRAAVNPDDTPYLFYVARVMVQEVMLLHGHTRSIRPMRRNMCRTDKKGCNCSLFI